MKVRRTTPVTCDGDGLQEPQIERAEQRDPASVVDGPKPEPTAAEASASGQLLIKPLAQAQRLGLLATQVGSGKRVPGPAWATSATSASVRRRPHFAHTCHHPAAWLEPPLPLPRLRRPSEDPREDPREKAITPTVTRTLVRTEGLVGQATKTSIATVHQSTFS